jgi:alkanesulfonate monooxygenase SsuD/methylene tetrahydromethanopterin reductase-like flavin-dependent oxidoreductase (luciferase family)
MQADALTFGYLIPTRDAIVHERPQVAPLLTLGERAEELGFDALWVGDGPLARPRHDALTLLAALGARTERVLLGTGVLVAALRSALLLAQAAATVDQIARGRLILGVGAGFPFPETEHQFQAVGVPYEGRIGRMRETIAAMRALWQQPGEPIDYHGKHIELQNVMLAPSPHRPGGPPVWLAGIGEAAERRVARIADGWLPYPPTPEQYAESWQRVQDAGVRARREQSPHPGLYATICLDENEQLAKERLRESIERYYGQPPELIAMIQALFAGTPDGLADWLEGYVHAGARHLVMRIADDDCERGLEAAGTALAHLRARLTYAIATSPSASARA